MKKILFTLLVTPLMLLASDLIVKTGELSVDDTITKIETIVTSKAKEGLGVFTIIDHKKGADKVKMALSDTKVIIFGNPKLGTKLMQKDPLVALDLPLKVLVYAEDNQTKIVYRDPIKWSEKFDLKACKMVDKMVKALNGITTAASKK
ncbi:MAG: Unknown protein [uncultured Sulfurovum sp.]|uniref:DUF302 domain-containing protein n=1 Tax=uncultured Sulfurovum sp. TaxID=269237 RepID=A0A6S6TFM3_9BACT|nr:MAG: Unknown protein [uncultured Sulfurovum sp.]